MNYITSRGGINIDGIPLTCDWADVVEEEEDPETNKIFISGIREDVDEDTIRTEMEPFGKVRI